MKLTQIFDQFPPEFTAKTLRTLDDAPPAPAGDALLRCPEITYATDKFVDRTMESVASEVPVSVSSKRGPAKRAPVLVDVAALRAFEADARAPGEAAVVWAGGSGDPGRVVYTRESLNGTLLAMQLVSRLFEDGITMHVPITMDAVRCRDPLTGTVFSLIYTELIRTRYRDGGRTVSLADVLDPGVDEGIPGLHRSAFAALVLKVQAACTLDLLDSYDLYLGNIDAGGILVSRFRKRPFFRGKSVDDDFAETAYVLSDGSRVHLQNTGYYVRFADTHTLAAEGKLIFRGFLDGSEGSESGAYAPGAASSAPGSAKAARVDKADKAHKAHVATHDYSRLRAELFDGDDRPFAEIARDLAAKIPRAPKRRKSAQFAKGTRPVLRIESRQIGGKAVRK